MHKDLPPAITFDTNRSGMNALELGAVLRFGQDIGTVKAPEAVEAITQVATILATPKHKLELEYPYVRFPEYFVEDGREEFSRGVPIFLEMFYSYSEAFREPPDTTLYTPIKRHVAGSFIAMGLGLLSPIDLPTYKDDIDFAEQWPGRFDALSFFSFDQIARLSVQKGANTEELRVHGKRWHPPSDRIVTGLRNGKTIVDSTKDNHDTVQAYTAELREKAALLAGQVGTKVAIGRIEGGITDFRHFFAKTALGTKAYTRHLPPNSEVVHEYVTKGEIR